MQSKMTKGFVVGFAAGLIGYVVGKYVPALKI